MSIVVSGYLPKPYIHVLVFLVLSLVVFVILRPKDPNAVYSTAGVMYAVFILVNSFLIFYAPNTWFYFFVSLVCSLAYVLAIVLLASLYIRLASLEGSGESAMTFLIIIYHPFTLLLMILLKWGISRM